MVVSFIPGLLLVIVPLTAGRDQTLALIGGLLIAGPAVIWRGTFRVADEVTVSGDQIGWIGLRCTGSAQLDSLRAVKPAGFFGGAMLTFVIDGKRRFEIAPARGIDTFLDALQKARPSVQIELPSSLRRFGRLQCGRFLDYER